MPGAESKEHPDELDEARHRLGGELWTGSFREEGEWPGSEAA